jgi:transcriptional regulator with XRE-family HTH domain
VAKDLQRAVGRRVRELRIERGLSQETLAHRARVHRNYVGYVERAERRITIDTLGRLAGVLDVSLAEFFAPFSEPMTGGRSHLIRLVSRFPTGG